MNDMVLVKVKIMKAEYYEPKIAGRLSWWQNAIHTVSAWFNNSHCRPDTYFPAS
jgi:hypothetical protein